MTRFSSSAYSIFFQVRGCASEKEGDDFCGQSHTSNV